MTVNGSTKQNTAYPSDQPRCFIESNTYRQISDKDLKSRGEQASIARKFLQNQQDHKDPEPCFHFQDCYIHVDKTMSPPERMLSEVPILSLYYHWTSVLDALDAKTCFVTPLRNASSLLGFLSVSVYPTSLSTPATLSTSKKPPVISSNIFP